MKFFFDAWTLVAFSGSLGVQITVVFSSLDAGFNSWLFSLLGCLRSILIGRLENIFELSLLVLLVKRFTNISIYSFLDDQTTKFLGAQAGSWMYGFSALWMQVSMACSSIGFHGYISLDANFANGWFFDFLDAARLRIYCESIVRIDILMEIWPLSFLGYLDIQDFEQLRRQH
uniref:Uncharacterized protein n=1 Tax=Rhizophagus irregularis (strain DAOM 181602 / DAOM 197198 / MUCL 43194) TaxID=747089 RepID=U9TPX8_RHIID